MVSRDLQIDKVGCKRIIDGRLGLKGVMEIFKIIEKSEYKDVLRFIGEAYSICNSIWDECHGCNQVYKGSNFEPADLVLMRKEYTMTQIENTIDVGPGDVKIVLIENHTYVLNCKCGWIDKIK